MYDCYAERKTDSPYKTPMMPHKCPKGIRAGINIVKTALCITGAKVIIITVYFIKRIIIFTILLICATEFKES